MSIVASADSLGHVKPAPLKFASEGMFDDSLRGIDRAEKSIVTLYAGGLAQRKFEPHSRWRQFSGHDYEVASELFSHLDSADDEYNRLYSKLLWRRAELLVDLRWREINAVADELVRHRTLDNAGVRAAILGTRGLKPLDREINVNGKEIDHG